MGWKEFFKPNKWKIIITILLIFILIIFSLVLPLYIGCPGYVRCIDICLPKTGLNNLLCILSKVFSILLSAPIYMFKKHIFQIHYIGYFLIPLNIIYLYLISSVIYKIIKK